MCDLSDTPTRSEAGQFLPGRSGNPAGRPRGARNRASLLADLLEEGQQAAIVRGVVDRALAGDWAAQRACFTRLLAPVKAAPVHIDLPPIASAEDVAEAGSALIEAVAAGKIALSEALKVMRLLTAQLKIFAGTQGSRDGRSRVEAASPAQSKAPAAPRRTAPQRDVAASAPQPAGGDACISPVVCDAPQAPSPADATAGAAPLPPRPVEASRPSPAIVPGPRPSARPLGNCAVLPSFGGRPSLAADLLPSLDICAVRPKRRLKEREEVGSAAVPSSSFPRTRESPGRLTPAVMARSCMYSPLDSRIRGNDGWEQVALASPKGAGSAGSAQAGKEGREGRPSNTAAPPSRPGSAPRPCISPVFCDAA